MNRTSAWRQAVQKLLAPSVPKCQICGKESRSSREIPGLCADCAAAIPWIYSPRCRKCGRHVGCPDCSRSTRETPIICNRSAVAYSSAMRELLGDYKYRGNERLAPLLGSMLDRAYEFLKAEREAELTGERRGCSVFAAKADRGLPQLKRKAHRQDWQADLLVPVPVSEPRLQERGFNQAERLADVLSRSRGIPQLPLLIRTHHTGKQSFKHRAERLVDMKHAFAANPEAFRHLTELAEPSLSLVRPFRIIIVDDIYTTGSTVRSCADVISEVAVACGLRTEIYALTWARA